MEKHEVIIVGAGPAGLQLAKILAENGKDVLVLERLSEEKIGSKLCTGPVSPESREILRLSESLYDVAPLEWKNEMVHLPDRDIFVPTTSSQIMENF